MILCLYKRSLAHEICDPSLDRLEGLTHHIGGLRVSCHVKSRLPAYLQTVKSYVIRFQRPQANPLLPGRLIRPGRRSLLLLWRIDAFHNFLKLGSILSRIVSNAYQALFLPSILYMSIKRLCPSCRFDCFNPIRIGSSASRFALSTFDQALPWAVVLFSC